MFIRVSRGKGRVFVDEGFREIVRKISRLKNLDAQDV